MSAKIDFDLRKTCEKYQIQRNYRLTRRYFK